MLGCHLPHLLLYFHLIIKVVICLHLFKIYKILYFLIVPGILVAKKKLFKSPKPYISGGGTVFYVRRDAHRYMVTLCTGEIKILP